MPGTGIGDFEAARCSARAVWRSGHPCPTFPAQQPPPDPSVHNRPHEAAGSAGGARHWRGRQVSGSRGSVRIDSDRRCGMTDIITVRGVVATEVDAGLTNGGHPAASFRLASTERRRDNETQQWVDRSTNWYTVKAFRHLAQNIGSSLRKGDRIVVTGKLQLRQWTGDDGRRRTYPEIIADSVGHDLKWGTAKFARSTEPRLAAESGALPAGAPGGDEDLDNVDLATGEVFEDLEPVEDDPGTGGDAPDDFKLAG